MGKSKVFVGTSGWAYGTWKPGFYPAKMSSKNFLNFYATKFNSVEVNYTFGRILTGDLSQRWMDEVPAGFEFSFKAPKAVTHSRDRLKDSEVLHRFAESLEPFREAKKLGVVLFQLPPHAKCDVELLGGFANIWPKTYRAAFELRHDSWFNDEVFKTLKTAGMSLCIAESEKLETPDEATAKFVYYRLRLPEYSEKELDLRSQKLSAHAKAGRVVYAYLKHEESPVSTVRALRVQQTVEG